MGPAEGERHRHRAPRARDTRHSHRPAKYP
jgi:hypothetical protein